MMKRLKHRRKKEKRSSHFVGTRTFTVRSTEEKGGSGVEDLFVMSHVSKKDLIDRVGKQSNIPSICEAVFSGIREYSFFRGKGLIKVRAVR